MWKIYSTVEFANTLDESTLNRGSPSEAFNIKNVLFKKKWQPNFCIGYCLKRFRSQVATEKKKLISCSGIILNICPVPNKHRGFAC